MSWKITLDSDDCPFKDCDEDIIGCRCEVGYACLKELCPIKAERGERTPKGEQRHRLLGADSSSTPRRSMTGNHLFEIKCPKCGGFWHDPNNNKPRMELCKKCKKKEEKA